MNSEENKEYSVNWKNHMTHVRKAFDYLLNTNQLTDVTLYCEGKKIGAHKVILSACSTYFRETFNDVPCQHPVIILYGVEFSVLSDILHFIYNGEVSVDTSKLDSFLKTGQLLQISGLTDSTNDKPIIEGYSNLHKAESYTEYSAASSIVNDKRSSKRPKTEESDAPQEKVARQESDIMFVSDVKCEPSELVNFEDPLEDPLLQSEQAGDLEQFLNTSGSHNVREEDLKHMSDSEGLPSDIEEAGTSTSSSLLPEKSQRKYEQTYERFIQWCKQKSVTNETSEQVLLMYFEKLSKTYKSSSLWAYYSMLRATISMKKNVDISRYNQLIEFLKRKAEGYKPKKSKVFSKVEIARFLKEADDENFLLIKVALIIGIAGACRKEELTNLLLENVKDEGQVFHIQIPHAKPKISRQFFVTSGSIEGCNMVEILRKYVKLRPRHADHGRFFVGYRRGFCTKQPVGINTFGDMPKRIASFLKLSNPEEYTGHCFRRSSASLLVDNGSDIFTGR